MDWSWFPKYLPQLVDGLTPNGTIPTGATLLSQASSLLGRFTSGG